MRAFVVLTLVSFFSNYFNEVIGESPLYTNNPDHQNALWNAFKLRFDKLYQSFEDETYRFRVFLDNLKLADLRNKVELATGGTGRHGINKFSDMSPAEFKDIFLNFKPALLKHRKAKTLKPLQRQVNTTKGFVDWTDGFTTPGMY
jgi:hypothetical protein